MSKGIRVGLTGGMGSGKSTVAAFLEKLGAVVVDADALSRATTAPGGAAIPEIVRVFGSDFLTADGALDRVKMREFAFKTPETRRTLESIIHPLVGTAIRQATQEADARSAPCVVYDIPLLIESAHWRNGMETILVIDCTEQTQIQRVRARNGIAESDVCAILAAQATRMTRLRGADHVICNEGIPLPQLEALTRQLSRQFGL